MNVRRLPAMALCAVVLLSAAACQGDETEPEASGATTAPSSPSASATPDEVPAAVVPADVEASDYDPAFFDETSATVDNQWLPLEPGTQYVYRGSTLDGKERIPHKVVFTVTDLSKVIDGVRTVIIWDRDYTDGELEETELAMFAQDTAGNVWHFGQYPEEYDGRKFVKAPAWVAGFEGARTGITVKAEPHPDGPSYSQGYAPPPLNWVDRARVYQVDQETCVPYDCFDGVLVTEEFERTKPGAFQLKYYAPGVGNVRVGWRGRNEEEQETLVLIDVIHLNEEEMAEIRELALELDANGYRRAEGSWGQTPPAEQLQT
ncbi:MAG TPA: hypothetical protein VFR44_02680 [Actinomycetota bacterium]|nr:hypothetical protein [Actinomycetota bacterium]